tara:strand:- start:545 stop:1936 length:1392 start_codon:yes stop_codon:yes gene_type:complete
MATNETKLPSIPPIPSDVDPKLKTYLSAVDEALKVRLGTLGDPKDRAVTVRELIDTGLAENFLENPFNPDAGTPENTFVPTERVDVTIPPDVTGFSGTGAFQKIILSWDQIQFGNFAFTEVWRHTSNDIGSATRIDTTRTSVYADTVDLNSDFYYWVRHVSTSNIEGQFTNGINVTTSKVSSSNVTDFFVADAITAASGVIADAAIGTAEIDDAAITNAKILNLDGSKINTNTLNADRITANTVNGVQKGTAHSFSTIKVESQSTAIISDIDRDGTILNNVGGSHVCYGYRCVVEDNMRFGNTFGASTPYFAYNKLYNGSYYNIHLKRLGSVSFTVISQTQGVYAGQVQTTFFGAYTGDERLFITASFGTTGTTQSTYVASETNGSGATGTTTSTQFNKGSSWVDFHNMGSSGAQMRMSFNSFYLSTGTYHLNVWGGVSLAGPNSQGQHQFDTTLISVFKQHI